MGLITIISDWGNNDHYLAATKAKIYAYHPDAKILDITHHVPPFDLGKTAHFLQNVYPHSPEGTVHIIAINTIADAQTAHLIVRYDDQYFIAADNGIFHLLFPELPTEVYEITEMQDSESFVFPERDLFAKVAAKLAQGVSPQELGTPAKIQTTRMRALPVSRIQQDENNEDVSAEIFGGVVYIDRFDNIHTNISRTLFEDMQRKFNRFEIACTESIMQISTAYSDVKESDILALFSSDGNLQIAINKGKAASLLGIGYRSQIVIHFKNS